MDFIDFIELAYWVKYSGLSVCSGGQHLLVSAAERKVGWDQRSAVPPCLFAALGGTALRWSHPTRLGRATRDCIYY